MSAERDLILNACEGALQIAVVDADDGRAVVTQEWRAPDRATEILAPALQQICRTLDMRASAFRHIACVRGPGSFTGIRLVLATAAALRRTGRAVLAGLDYLQCLAATAAQRPDVPEGARVHCATHARRGFVHHSAFVSRGAPLAPEPAGGVALVAVEDCVRAVAEGSAGDAEPPVFLCGSAFARSPALFAPEAWAGRTPGTVRLLADLVSPSFDALCLLARHADYAASDIEPLYVRPCDAVENLPRLAARQGLDGEAAVRELEGLLAARPASLL
ncbi:MAG: tRNA (adenosine(37)-N6)-threonylcarbamoyltransferase complex dimerization subunit type 1 TsaB [Desulfovibrio sp.]|nr:tRNA (adenosine(37)-N6)-threonylcarbamoyltransferase complex dimerization subunit type 1 TsaB [Desulfovibrio sp.]